MLAEVDVRDRLTRQRSVPLTPGRLYAMAAPPSVTGNCNTVRVRARQLVGVHRHVGRAEVDVASRELFDAAAAADGLIVDGDVGILLIVRVERFGEEWIIELDPAPVNCVAAAAGSVMAARKASAEENRRIVRVTVQAPYRGKKVIAFNHTPKARLSCSRSRLTSC